MHVHSVQVTRQSASVAARTPRERASRVGGSEGRRCPLCHCTESALNTIDPRPARICGGRHAVLVHERLHCDVHIRGEQLRD